MNATKFQDLKIDVRLKLAALWTSIMFFYVYADLLGFMQASPLQPRGMLT